VVNRVKKSAKPGSGEPRDIVKIVRAVAKIADDKKADYIKILDMSSRLIITDYFIIIGARNTRLTRRIQEEICIYLKSKNLNATNISGLPEGEWILIDYNDFVVHIFTNELREYYGLERLWRDSAEIEWSKDKPVRPVKPIKSAKPVSPVKPARPDRIVKNKSFKDKHI
jgi:ribosome-associated protein